MVTAVLTNLEIAFWKTAIPLMRESQFVQTCVQRIFPVFQLRRRYLHQKAVLGLLLQTFGLALAGLVLGFAAGLLISIG
jgi:hypothetical protein